MPNQGAVDQEARDLAHAAIATIDRHEAVCQEAERRRSEQIGSMERKLEGWLQRIQTTFETQNSEMSIRHSNMASIINGNVNKFFDEQKAINNQLFGRFWWLIVVYAGAATTVAGVLLGEKLLHIP